MEFIFMTVVSFAIVILISAICFLICHFGKSDLRWFFKELTLGLLKMFLIYLEIIALAALCVWRVTKV